MRIKKVFSNHDQVLHLWANQSQDEARCKNVFFHGKNCYSYGHHYLLGTLVKYKGKTVAVINDSGYSVTTSKHIASAWDAVENQLRIKTKNINSFNMVNILINIQSELIDLVMSQFRGRSFYDNKPIRDYDLKQIKEFNKLCIELKHKEFVLEFNDEILEALKEHKTKCITKEKIRDAEKSVKREQANKLAQEKLKEEIQAWRQGGPLTQGMHNISPQLIRVKGEMVETSRGAEVTLKQAKTLLGLIHFDLHTKGERIGQFTLDSVKGNLVRIGCHEVDLNEAKKVLGFKE